MTSISSPGRRVQLISMLIFLLFAPTLLMAQGQAVTSSELRNAIRKASDQKQKDLEQVRSFFSGPQVRDALSKGGIRYDQVQKAVSSLDADAIAKLATQTAKLQTDFAAGALSNQELTYIVIAIGAALIVIIAVVA